MLQELGHPQPPTRLQTDNSTAFGIITNEIILKATKAMDMRFHWLCNRAQQQQYQYYWWPRKINYMDYWTKHHPMAYHEMMQAEYMTPTRHLNSKRNLMQAKKVQVHLQANPNILA